MDDRGTTRRAFWQPIVVVFLAALLLRLFVFAYIVHEPRKFYTYDSDGYDRRAINLLAYGQFASEKTPPLTPDLDRTPTYPVFLAAIFATVGHQPWVVGFLQAFIGALTAVLAYLLARELKLSQLAAIVAGLIVALDPVAAMNSNRILTETLFTTLVVAAAWLLVRFWKDADWRIGLIAALLLAVATLTRPINQFLPIALLPMSLLALRHLGKRTMLIGTLLVTLVSFLLPYGWAYRNYKQTGLFTLSTIGDTNLAYYRARAVLAEAEKTSQDAAWAKIQTQVETTAAQQRLGPAGVVALQRDLAITIFERHPVLTAKMFAKGVARIAFDPGYTITCTLLDRTSTAFDCFPGKSSMNEPGLVGKAFGKIAQMSVVQVVTLVWSVILLGFTYLCATIGLVQLVRERRWLALALLLVMIAYFVGLAAGAESNSRFRIPAMPFVALLAGVGAHTAWVWYASWAAKRNQPKETAAAGGVPEAVS